MGAAAWTGFFLADRWPAADRILGIALSTDRDRTTLDVDRDRTTLDVDRDKVALTVDVDRLSFTQR